MAGDDQGRQRVQSQLLKKLKGVSLEAEEVKKEDGVGGDVFETTISQGSKDKINLWLANVSTQISS